MKVLPFRRGPPIDIPPPPAPWHSTDTVHDRFGNRIAFRRAEGRLAVEVEGGVVLLSAATLRTVARICVAAADKIEAER